MRLAVLILVLSICAAVAAIYLHGPALSAPVLLALLCAIAGVILLISAASRRRRKYIVIDGSNVMHWDGDAPALETVKKVVGELKGLGFTPVIWFDANAGYLVGNRYMGPDRLAARVGISARQVFVAPKGIPADPLLLEGAARLNARVVTNDRFRDWNEDHPEVQNPSFLVKGDFRNGVPVLHFSD